jgi:hypothetical protein
VIRLKLEGYILIIITQRGYLLMQIPFHKYARNVYPVLRTYPMIIVAGIVTIHLLRSERTDYSCWNCDDSSIKIGEDR